MWKKLIKVKWIRNLINPKDRAHSFEYDLIVIGCGSGGYSVAMSAANLGKKVALFDFVQPSPFGTTWGIGGTCVNVGCVPKKLFHQAALLREYINDSLAFGWRLDTKNPTIDWSTLVNSIQSHILATNWSYRVALNENKVNYINSYAKFVNRNTVIFSDKESKGPESITGNHIVICVGCRPRYLEDIPGAGSKDGLCLTSDDLFSLPQHPGKVCLIGASYISLECAGFLTGVGVDTTVLVRGWLLSGFDMEMGDRIGESMKQRGTKFLNGWYLREVKLVSKGSPREIGIVLENINTGKIEEHIFNTVILAVGRESSLKDMNLSKAGVKIHKRTRKIIVNKGDRTNASNIFAIGDCAHRRPELTPPAIRAGYLLANRLYGDTSEMIDYNLIPTTVFTPIEYGSIGLSEEDAVRKYGGDRIEVYHTQSQPLEFVVPARDTGNCYSKLIIRKSRRGKEYIIGFHYLGPNAGEITQGFSLVMKLNATKADFDSLIGIHPTSAEIFTTLTATKSSGAPYIKSAC